MFPDAPVVQVELTPPVAIRGAAAWAPTASYAPKLMSVVLIEQDMAILAVTAKSDVAGDAKADTFRPAVLSAMTAAIVSLKVL
jgi:hypothetical protein